MNAFEDEMSDLRKLAEIHLTLRELREAAPASAEGFLLHCNKKSGNWPVVSLLWQYEGHCHGQS